MRGIRLAASMMVAGLLAWTGAARAEDADTVRLGGTDAAPAQNLLNDGKEADTISVYRGGFRAGGAAVARTPFGTYAARGGIAAGYRGGFGGYRGGFGGYRGYGGFGGYRAGFGGYRGFGYGGYGFGGYRGFGYRGFGYGGLGYGGFGYGYRPYYGIGYGGYGGYGFYAPCAYGTAVGVTTLAMPAVSYTVGEVVGVSPAVPVTPGTPAPAPGDATYPYDGGPSSPVPTPQPMPKADPAPAAPAPAAAPVPSVPLEGRAVSLPKTSGRWTYPAYGEAARRTSAAQDRTLVIRK